MAARGAPGEKKRLGTCAAAALKELKQILLEKDLDVREFRKEGIILIGLRVVNVLIL